MALLSDQQRVATYGGSGEALRHGRLVARSDGGWTTVISAGLSCSWSLSADSTTNHPPAWWWSPSRRSSFCFRCRSWWWFACGSWSSTSGAACSRTPRNQAWRRSTAQKSGQSASSYAAHTASAGPLRRRSGRPPDQSIGGSVGDVRPTVVQVTRKNLPRARKVTALCVRCRRRRGMLLTQLRATHEHCDPSTSRAADCPC